MVSDSFTLSAIELPVNKDGKSTSLGEIMKRIMFKFKIKIEASANQKTRQTTFHMKSESQKDLDKAKRDLLALLSPVVTLTLPAPASIIGLIIGPKGATLKQIRDQTGVRIDIPRKESATPNGHVNGSTNGTATSAVAEDEEEPTVPVTITGPQPLAYEAQSMLNEIISARTSNLTQRVKDIPAYILPFVTARRALFIEAAQGGDVNLTLNASDYEITVSGDREAVVRVVETIKVTIKTFKTILIPVKISLPKRQHHLLVGKAIEEIMGRSRCSVVVPKPDEPGEEVVVYGKQEDISAGLAAVMEQANSQYIHEFPLPGPITVSRQLLTYMTHINYSETLSAVHPGALVFTPSATAITQGAVLNIDILGEKPVVDAVVRQVSELLGKLIGATKEVSIGWLIHRVIMGKSAKKLKQFRDAHNVQVIFPPESAEQSLVLLVYDPLSPSASPSPVEKEKHLDEVATELLNIVKELGDVKSERVVVEKRWHEAVIGRDGTGLDMIIGEDNGLSIKVGAEAGDPSNEDSILVHGPSADVDQAVKEILRVVEEAKNDAIVSSYFTEFDIDREYVGRIVGAQGVGVNKLREQFGVKVDVSDEVEEKEKESSKKKKPVHQKSKVKITGRKENVEEAKKRILAQVERLADETSQTLKIPAQYHASLIGQNGKYAIRLEEKYEVKITFPRGSSENGESKTRETLKPDEVLVKGGKKGVAGAKSELLEALEFEIESNNVLKFTVPTRAVARILGKGGVSINEIKDDTGAQIDIDKAFDDNNAVTSITVRGTKEAINAAKTSILEIAGQVGEETTASLDIETKYHGTIIGAGGQGLKDLIIRCGGPSDPKLQAGLIRFPRQGEPSNEVRLRGEPALLNKIKVELEKTVVTLRDRVVLAVEIPAVQHRNLIGRGGQHLSDLQNRMGVQVQFPGSRSYSHVGEAVNASEVKDADLADIVKVSGSRSACEAAITDLQARIQNAPAPVEMLSAVVSVPLKYHHAISQQGNFFRNLRSYGVQVEQSAHPQKSAVPVHPPQVDTSAARIDDAAEDSHEVDWQVVPNYQDAEEGDSEWTLRAKDAAGLEGAQNDIRAAIEQAEAMTHVGFLTLADRSAFPRLVGSKGSNVARLRAETGADITVSRENNTVVIIGSESAVEMAKEAILKQAASPPRLGRR
ncbi:SCP160 protein [Gyrodon lividus]|nr:SCP160 protein [Gyrodon lividus]